VTTAGTDLQPTKRPDQHLTQPDTSGADAGAEPLADAVAAAQPLSRLPVAGQVDPAAAPAAAGTYPHQRALPVLCSPGTAARVSRASTARLCNRHGQRRHSGCQLRGQAVQWPLPSSNVLGEHPVDQLALAGDGLHERISHGAHQRPAGT